MFTIDTKESNLGRLFVLMNLRTGEHVSIAADMGGAIASCWLGNQRPESICKELSPIGDTKMKIHSDYSGMKLFPYVNRTNKGKYTWEGITYELPLGEHHAIHGFLWNTSLRWVEQKMEEDAASLVLEHVYDGHLEGYPFPLKISIKYKLKENKLTLTTKVTNLGSAPAILGDGWHPYFHCTPSIDHWCVDMNVAQYWDVVSFPESAYAQNYVEPVFQTFALASMNLDHCFAFTPTEVNTYPIVHLYPIHAPEEGVVLHFKEGYRYVHLYTPLDRSYVAIEPCSMPPDGFNAAPIEGTIASMETKKYVFQIERRGSGRS
ncbi:MAG: aldose 1-epimerase [Cytophagaceae bacterium]|jgi:aldose 1-epimerase|nr:aldose 1-epimerase [Cytophagaceae bacterium]